MSVVNVTEIMGRSGEADDKITVRNRRTFRVVTNDPRDGDILVRNAIGIPRVFDIYQTATEINPNSICKVVRAEDTELPTVWIVTCEYSNEQDRPQEQNNENPLLRPADVSWGAVKYERPLYRDLRGVPVKNSADEPFDPPLTVEDSRLTLVYERNEATFSPTLALLYQDAVNSDVFLGSVNPRQAKVNAITGNRQFENNIIFWRVRYEFEFRRETFDYKILDRGFRDIDGNLFRDPIDQMPLSQATLLGGNGESLKSVITVNLAAGVDAFQTTVFLSSDQTIPDINYYESQIKVDSEVMLVLSHDSVNNSITVARGWAGTTAAAHANNAVVKLEPVYVVFRAFKELPFSILRILL